MRAPWMAAAAGEAAAATSATARAAAKANPSRLGRMASFLGAGHLRSRLPEAAFQGVEERHQERDREEAASRKREEEERLLLGDRGSEDGPGAEDFPEHPDHHEREEEAESHPETVPEGRDQRHARREHLQAGDDDREGHDELH